VDVGRKDVGNLIFLEKNQQSGGQLRAQAVVILAPPGVKEGNVEKNQPGLGSLRFLQFGLQPAKLSRIHPLFGGIVDQDEIVAVNLKGIVIRPEDFAINFQAPLPIEFVIADHR